MRDRGQAGKHLCPVLPSNVPLDRAESLYQLHSLPKSKWKKQNNHGWGRSKAPQEPRLCYWRSTLNKSKTAPFKQQFLRRIGFIWNHFAMLKRERRDLLFFFWFYSILKQTSLVKTTGRRHKTLLTPYCIYLRLSNTIHRVTLKTCFGGSRIKFEIEME